MLTCHKKKDKIDFFFVYKKDYYQIPISMNDLIHSENSKQNKHGGTEVNIASASTPAPVPSSSQPGLHGQNVASPNGCLTVKSCCSCPPQSPIRNLAIVIIVSAIIGGVWYASLCFKDLLGTLLESSQLTAVGPALSILLMRFAIVSIIVSAIMYFSHDRKCARKTGRHAYRSQADSQI